MKKDNIEKLWSYSAKGYSDIIQDELNSFRSNAWTELIESQIEYKMNLNILDIGTGPGFFSIILSKRGYKVTGIDCTKDMIKEAKQNAKLAEVNPEFIVMDSQDLDFEDNTFDLLLSRNVTWTLTDPIKAYKEWFRVLKPKGVLLIFDANWNLHKYNKFILEEVERREIEFRRKYGNPYNAYNGPEEYKDIGFKLPLEDKIRPEWDENILDEIGFINVEYDRDITIKVWDEKELLLYGATPMFMISAKKLNMLD